MTETTVQSNNKSIAYRGRAQRERPRLMGGLAVASQSQSDGGPYENQEDQGDARMPWTAKSFKSRHNKKASPSQAASAAKQATAMVNSGVDEGIAIATANKRIGKMKRSGTISNRAADKLPRRADGGSVAPLPIGPNPDVMESVGRDYIKPELQRMISNAPPPTPAQQRAFDRNQQRRNIYLGRVKGGKVKRGSYLVGEKGPEIFEPDVPGNIIPNNRTKKLVRQGAISNRAADRGSKYAGHDQEGIDASSR